MSLVEGIIRPYCVYDRIMTSLGLHTEKTGFHSSIRALGSMLSLPYV